QQGQDHRVVRAQQAFERDEQGDGQEIARLKHWRYCLPPRLTRTVSSYILDSMGLEPDLYLISMAARMLGMHPQTLRKYERLGLVQPTRTIGSMRLYSRDELDRLKVIKRLEIGRAHV